MHHQVGVAADGRGEVGVVGEGEAVVADILGAVIGFGHGADGDGVDHVLLAASGDVFEEAVVALCKGFARGGFHAEAQLGNELDESVELLGVRFVMDTVDEGFARSSRFSRFTRGLTNVLGDGAVGQEHELLDEPIGLLALLDVDADGLGVFVELELHFLRLKVDGAAAVTGGTQLLCDGMEGEDGLANRLSTVHCPLSIISCASS